MAPDVLFVYGSLQFPEVLDAVLHRVPERTPAQAAGWRVATLPGRVYPALVPAENVASGFLISNLTAEEWRALDAFEDDVYELRQLVLTDRERGWAYVCLDETVAGIDNWRADNFVEKHLNRYVEDCARWRSWYESRYSR